jgi:hypothetical protein
VLSVNNSGALVAPVSFEVGTMKVLILRDTVCGHVPVFAGDVVEASDSDARILIMANKAVESVGDEGAKPKVRTRKQATDDAGE